MIKDLNKVKLVDGLILVKPFELPKDEKIENNIIIETKQNQSVVDRPYVGSVIKSSSEKFNINDTVFWYKNDGIDIEIQNIKYLILREDSILGFC